MTHRDQLDEILNSHINGQGRQMVRQMDELGGYDIAELIEYYEELNRSDEIPDLMKRYFRIKYR